MRNIHQGNSTASAHLGSKDLDADITGFFVHPAVLDNALQLGAMVPEASSATPTSDTAYVPAAVAVYSVGCRLQQGAAVHAAVKRSADSARRSATATYRDHSLMDATGAVLAVLDGLEAKPLQSAGRAGVAADKSAVAQPQEFLYEVTWQAASAAAATDYAQQLEAPGKGEVVVAFGGQNDAVGVASSALLTMQAGLQASASGVQLRTIELAPLASMTSDGSNTGASSGVWGMLRAFAAEAPAVTHGGRRVDARTASPSARAQAIMGLTMQPAGASDGYGTAVHGGTGLQAVLLPSACLRPSDGPYHLMPRPRGAFSSLVAEAVSVGSSRVGWVEVEVKAVGINFRCAVWDVVPGKGLQHAGGSVILQME
jgi:hypothetical protein